MNGNHDKNRGNIFAHGSNVYTSKQDSKTIPSQKSNRKPYSFGDPRQLPSKSSKAHDSKTALAKQSPKNYKQHITVNHEFDTVLIDNQLQRTQCPSYCNTWTHEEIDDFCGGMRFLRSAETEFQKIQPPTDYASLFARESACPYEESLRNDYVLWPVNTTNESMRFSPTQLQQILLGKDVVKSNNNGGFKGESSCEKRGRKESFHGELKPAKRKMLDQVDKANTPDSNIKKTSAKAMHCVRRLFPINSDQNSSPKDSESDSEFCKNLSQDSSGQSENSDWTLNL